MGTTYRTRGTHDKWYWGWSRPGLGEAAVQVKVDAGFLDLVEGELCKHQINSNMARSRAISDSSNSSEKMLPAAHSKAAEAAKEDMAMYGSFELES